MLVETYPFLAAALAHQAEFNAILLRVVIIGVVAFLVTFGILVGFWRSLTREPEGENRTNFGAMAWVGVLVGIVAVFALLLIMIR